MSLFFLFPFRWQNVSLSGRGRPGLSDVSVCVCACSVLCLSASCLPPRPLSTHFLLHTQSEVWPHLYLQPLFFNLSIFCHLSEPTSSSPLSLFSFSFAWLPSPVCSSSSWISVLQNSKEEALNQAFKGDQHVGENNIVQELTKAILGEVKRMTGNDVCCDCGAPSEW